MDNVEKMLSIASSVGLLMEFKCNLIEIDFSQYLFLPKSNFILFKAFLKSDPQATRALALWRGTKMTFYSSVLIWLFYKWMQSKSKKEV